MARFAWQPQPLLRSRWLLRLALAALTARASLAALAYLAAAAPHANATAARVHPSVPGRRHALLAVAAAAAATPRPTGAVKLLPRWVGKYSDPRHLNCKRNIALDGSDGLNFRITGYDGDPNCESLYGPRTPFELTARLASADSGELVIDFSPKGGPKDVVGRWEGDGIRFPDGNKWAKVGKMSSLGYTTGPGR
mmetsp:Transcript_92981/g.259021  ORF Transcript_92981/g.259021 Transcript_92981/m.259021 type:complete len:194 (-) Transcript_92981:127-708(-)|eukprot:CAMPEP_0179090570 /NCGR_PEP_ID=MMETSP0796-20121207/41327_1 /TAXON_ID=73915 /ORGANISM="Pyrodinium bahamense, Strain pbaha01" /LENGTH=193 /DNA_ID=CAMNT_0020788143 /DNA_START=101 /DNA_END=682 /DNA_ORIENTATION=-